ncbi:MAG: mechanosensitive ion channel protein [Rhodospirillales bacterium]|nr:mechanosensitive ion channel protein [Rhodospirillales bacterium]
MIDRSLTGRSAAARVGLTVVCHALLVVLVLVLGVVRSTPAVAQSAPAGSASTPAPVSVDELQRLVDTLQNDQQRAQLVQQLQALVAAQRAEQEKSAVIGPVTLLEQFSQRADSLSGEILAAAAVVVDAPRLIAWLRAQASDEYTRSFWLEVGLKLCIIFGLALFSEWLVRRILARPRHALAESRSDHLVLRLVLTLLRAALDALPILAFAVVAYVTLVTIDARFGTSKVATTLIGAYVTARIITALARIALLPRSGAPLFAWISDETRGYLFVWIKRFTYWSVYGYAVASGAWWLGVPGSIYGLLLKAVALVLALLAIIFVLQNRATVSAWLRGAGEPLQPARSNGWRLLRARLADVWHILAIAYIVGIYLVYALRVAGGFLFVLRGTLVTLVVVVAARVIVNLVRRFSQRGFAVGNDLKSRFPTLEQRANRYVPVLTNIVAGLVYAFAALAVLEAWSIPSFAWFGSEIGRRLTSGLITTGTVIVGALVVWEIFTSAIERYLNAVDENGMPVPRSARARTLLPLLRTMMMILIVVMVSLIVLSELGVNIAPLLAGAGVVGLAIGFGSQALVKDVITGLFILIEDSLAVGDVVDLGKGHVGVVEAISVRTIRLRDAAGAVHSIPFSEVTSVNNLTKDFAYYVCNASISYREDVDRVSAILIAVGDDLYDDAEYRPFMLDKLEFLGIDKMSELGIVLQARIKTLPRQQWKIGREFSRRMKLAFDRECVEMPYAVKPGYLADIAERLKQAAAASQPESSDVSPPAKRLA